MRWGVTSKLSIGFAATAGLFLVFWLAAAYQMHQTFEELKGVHQGYLSLNRLVTQIKSLADVQDERVRRITSEANPAVQQHLRTYFLANFPDSLPKKVDALLVAIKGLQNTPLGQNKSLFLLG